MSGVLSLKVTDETVARVDALITAIQKTAPDATVRRADVLRAILDVGLPVVEARYGMGEKGGKRPARKPPK